MYICVFVYGCLCMSVHTHILNSSDLGPCAIYAYIQSYMDFAHMHVCVCIYIYIYIYIYMSMYICVYMYMCIYIYIYIYVCMYIYIYHVLKDFAFMFAGQLESDLPLEQTP
jgi:hypothetical protein